MDIIILSAGRATRAQQVTLQHLSEDGIPVQMAVQDAQYDSYARALGQDTTYLLRLPPHIKTVAATRDYLIHDVCYSSDSDSVLMLDDDLDFAVRREDDPTRFRPPSGGDLYNMKNEVAHQLAKHPMVSIGAREGGNRNVEPYLLNTRMMRALAFNRSFLIKHQITFAPMELMEDFHVALQIMRLGFDTCVVNNWVTNQRGGSNAPGGCSTYRTPALQAEEAAKLAARHPGFVKVVQKTTKGAWGGGTRTDVTVQWKQARKSGGPA